MPFYNIYVLRFTSTVQSLDVSPRHTMGGLWDKEMGHRRQ